MTNKSVQVIEGNLRMPHWAMAAIGTLTVVSIAGMGLAWHNFTALQKVHEEFRGQMKSAEANTNQFVTVLEQRLTDANAATANLQRDLVVVEKGRPPNGRGWHDPRPLRAWRGSSMISPQ